MEVEESEERCELLGNFGVIVQIILGCLSFTVLIFKRVCEHPKRSWKIWALVLYIVNQDVSKQAFSALLAHGLNLLLAIILSSQNANDECVWYFINTIFDTTIGVIICYLILKLLEKISLHCNVKSFKTGEYYDPKTGIVDYSAWRFQFFAWGGIVIIVKFL